MSGGAEGQIDVPNPMEASEPPAGMAGDVGFEDDRLNVPEGAQQHGPVSPSHGAAGGHDIPFNTQGAPPSTPGPRPEGTALKNPALGG